LNQSITGYKYWRHYPSLYSQRIHEEKAIKNTKIGSKTDSELDLKISRATELVDL